MALIKCPECGKEISDTATTCPHCGTITQHQKDLNAKSNIGNILIGIGVALSILGFLIGLGR